PRTMRGGRHTGQIPESTWTLGLRERGGPWKGALGCLGVAVFFAMRGGIISWQALEQPPEEWVLRGGGGGVLWERRRGALLLRALRGGRTAAVVAVVGGVPAAEPRGGRDRCWHDGGQFCYAWEEGGGLRVSLRPPPAPGTECYSGGGTPLRPDVTLKDCFSMANVSWYGGPSVRAQRWPLNSAESPPQPLVSGDFGQSPGGYGPVLEKYFLGSTGVTVTVGGEVPLFLSLESHRHFCLQSPVGSAAVPLSYQLCLSPDWGGPAQGMTPTALPPSSPLPRSPVWRYHGPEGSAAKIKRGWGGLAKRLKRHHLQEGVLALGGGCTALLAAAAHVPGERRKRGGGAGAWDPAVVAPLQLSVTGGGYTSIASPLFLRSLREGQGGGFWLSLQPPVPLLTLWKGRLCARLNVTSEVALSWFLARARRLRQALGATYVVVEGAEGNVLQDQALPPPPEPAGDRYTGVLAAALVALGNRTVISAGAGWVPGSRCFADAQDDAPEHPHLGPCPSLAGGSLAGDTPGDPELYVRWLQIVTFLPVMAFSTPPWLCCDAWVLNLTRQCIRRHRDLVVPLILKYSEEWLRLGYPIFRPAWWLSPTDPTAFTVEDEFLIGDEVLIAPVTEKGQTRRDIYLPGEGHLWLDTNTARVFDGGTVLRNYSASLAEVPVFVK
ncbi:SP15 protein, partial [Rostratula benghalensis]|nr:SP15 protein [Rostratula benghalensis]